MHALYIELVRLEPGMRAITPWSTGDSRVFLWLSAALVLVSVAVAAVKVLGWTLAGVVTVVAPERRI